MFTNCFISQVPPSEQPEVIEPPVEEKIVEEPKKQKKLSLKERRKLKKVEREKLKSAKKEQKLAAKKAKKSPPVENNTSITSQQSPKSQTRPSTPPPRKFGRSANTLCSEITKEITPILSDNVSKKGSITDIAKLKVETNNVLTDTYESG